MKKFFKEVIKNECKDEILFNYSCGEYDETIEARPYINTKDKIVLANSVWDVYYDEELDRFNVEILEPTIRMMIIHYYCIAPKIGIDEGIARYYPFLMCTSFYSTLCANVPDIAETLKCIHKTIEFNTSKVRDKDTLIDGLLVGLIKKIDSIIPQDFDMKDALNTYKAMVEMNNDEALIDKILSYHKNTEAGSDESNDKQGV